MERYFDVVTDRRGNAISGATVTIKNAAGATATIYSDNGVTTVGNPLTTNADGEYTFFAANGKYSVQIAAAGYGSEIKDNQILFDPADVPAVGIAGSNFLRMPVRELNTASYALTAGDAGWWLDVTASGTAVLTLSTAQPFAVGDTVIVRQRGVGQVQISAGPGTTLDASQAAKTYGQKSVIALTQVETARWSVYGDLASS